MTDTGITLAGPTGQKIVVDDDGVTIESSVAPVKIKGGGGVTVEAGTTLSLKGNATVSAETSGPLSLKGTTAKLEGVGVLDLKGALVRTGNGSCAPTARVNDIVFGTAPPGPAGGPIIGGFIFGPGSPTVLTC